MERTSTWALRHGATARTWYVNVTGTLAVKRTLDEFANSMRAVYEDASGRTICNAYAPTLSVELDRISTFTIGEIKYTSVDDKAELMPEVLLMRLDVLLAREAGGFAK